MSNSVKSNLPLKIVMIIYFIVPLGLYLNHKVVKVDFNKDKRYLVSEIIRDIENIVTIKFTNLRKLAVPKGNIHFERFSP